MVSTRAPKFDFRLTKTHFRGFPSVHKQDAPVRSRSHKSFTKGLPHFGNHALAWVHLKPMQIKTRRPIQILTLALAVSMLTAYVVYSQRERNRTVAPGSKSMALSGATKIPAAAYTLVTNPPGMVAPGSKSMEPILDLQRPHPNPSAQSTGSNPSTATVAPGSKSGRVFDLHQGSRAEPTANTPASGKHTL
ncbi:MAG: hypothetical protein QOJ40_306 [Verrucomicrobiota bacterium]